jgi:tetratricopeptide (TPR) repeat protein
VGVHEERRFEQEVGHVNTKWMLGGLALSTALACAGSKQASTISAPAADQPHEHAHGQAESWTLKKLAKGAVLLGDLGKVQRKVTTKVPEAQAFFDQGLALTYGFNHDEAARSFARAAELDPRCALCFWGAAYTLGPNYNIPMLPDRAVAAWEAISAAKRSAAGATPVEQALIAALAKRHTGPSYVDPAAMQPFNVAYADAMHEVAERFPDDLDVQVLAAEALMNVNPWKLWSPDGVAAEGTDKIVARLESVLAKAPEHAGANHYYIHAIEASKHPEKALASADRLPSLGPAAGHIVHMPAHIYQRVGRYADASRANKQAADVDEVYLRRVTPPGYYPMYTAHNYGFLAYSAAMQGASAVAIDAARRAASAMPRDLVCGMPGMDFFLSEPLLVLVRFGRWEEVLKEVAPDPKYQVLVALHHHARGMAFAATGKLDEARAEAIAIRETQAKLPEELLAGLNSGRLVLELAASVVEARIAEVARVPDAIAKWEAAVTIEDKLAYNEPADWFYSTRHYLGAALLDLGKAKEAEAVYRQDLTKYPNNGWALFGLSRALAKQRKGGKAKKEVDRALAAAWKDADVELTRSAF